MSHDIDAFSTATEMLAALRSKAISSVELTELHIERIERHDPALNAIVVPTFERARAEATAADERRARGEDAPLLGLPMTLKESEQVGGLPQSAGIPGLREYRASSDGVAARATLGNGACLLGKTNIPFSLGDWQADSPNYGRTCNPWDGARTPGGSTGGGSAALAAGLTPLEIGSDIGGSIRVPAAYCGVWGHRPSETAISRTGAFPLTDHPNPVSLMGVQGPLARSARDLTLAFDLMAGPEEGEDVAWRLELPAARHQTLGDFRVAILPPMPVAPLAGEIAAGLEDLSGFLSQRGASVAVALPEIDMEQYFADYVRLLQAMTSKGVARETREARAAALRKAGDGHSNAVADGLTLDVPALSALLDRREASRRAWRAFFGDWDVLVAPVALDVAFPHAEEPFDSRLLLVDGVQVPYFNNVFYPMLAILTGQPATAFPAGLGATTGLPVGLQAIGPYLEDHTTLRFAEQLEQEWRGFVPPPAYA